MDYCLACFFLISFLLLSHEDPMQEIIQKISFLTFIVVTTFTAKYIYINHYTKIKVSKINLITLLFVPKTFLLIVGVEVTANMHKIFEPRFLAQHLQYHIFDDTIVFAVMFLVM